MGIFDLPGTFVFIPFTFYVFVQYIYGNSILVWRLYHCIPQSLLKNKAECLTFQKMDRERSGFVKVSCYFVMQFLQIYILDLCGNNIRAQPFHCQ